MQTHKPKPDYGHFNESHAQVSPDPLVELLRRRQAWASVPAPDGSALIPPACIVPESTVYAACEEIIEARSRTGGALMLATLSATSGAIMGALIMWLFLW